MKIATTIILLGLISVTLFGETNIVARKDFDASEMWKPKQILDRDFWNMFFGAKYSDKKKTLRNQLYFPTASLPENMRKYLDIPAFTEVAIIPSSLTKANLRKNADGSMTLIPPDYSDWIPANRPYWLRNVYFTRLFPRFTDLRFHTEYKPDWELYKAWREKNPNFLAFYSLSEWGNNMNTLFMHLRNRYVKGGHLTPEQVDKIAETYEENPKTRRDYVNNRLRPDFDHAMKVGYNEITAMDGAWNIANLAAAWGAKLIGVETSRVYMNWQFQMMHVRGAARQFDIPWSWYAAAHATIRDKNGHSTGKGAEPYAWRRSERGGPDCGASLNSRMRVSYMAYLAGANFYQRETAEGNYWDFTAKGDDRWKPMPEGQMYIDFFNFTKKNPGRGTPYTPVALLVAHDRGTFRNPGKAFWRYAYTHGDNMLDAFICTIFPPFSASKAYRDGIEMTLLNCQYGDIFDILTPDFDDAKPFARILPAYKVAVLVGEYEKNQGMVTAMVNYVAEGGTLILNAKHLELGFNKEFTGISTGGIFQDANGKCTTLIPDKAAVIYADAAGRPLFTRNQYGKGAVIVAARHYLTQDFSADNANEVLGETINGKRKFPDIKWLLDHLHQEIVPAKVTGDIQYGFNKTAKGWWIYLFNNKGVMKTALTPQRIDNSADTVVEIEFTEMNPSAVRELFTEKQFSGKTIKVPVPAGSCRILEIVENKGLTK